MYQITKMHNGTYYCEGRVQDGWESWSKPTRKEAIQSMISFARVMNHSFIHVGMITFMDEKPPEPVQISQEDFENLVKIRSGSHHLVPYNDPYFKYNVTEGECEIIQGIREGKITTKVKKGAK